MRANQASVTATKVARLVLYLAHHPRLSAALPPGLGEWTERLLLAGGLARPWMISLYQTAAWRGLARWVERRTVAGQVLAIGLRKHFMDVETRRAVAEGATQVLVVGAGFDTLAPRLATELPDVLFVEVDHPATQGRKRAALDAMGPPAPNLRLVAADLAVRPLGDVIAEVEEWRDDAVSVVIAEGLLMYLEEAAVRSFFAQAHHATGTGSRVLFTWIPRDDAGALELGRLPTLVRRVLALIGEPLRWGTRPEDLVPFLAEVGYALVEDPARTDLHARFLVPVGLGDEIAGGAERVAIAVSAG